MAPHLVDDETRLRQLGYKQELKREFNLWKNFGVTFGNLSMLTALGGFYYFGFTYGGPVVCIWGWVLLVSMTMTIASSMAEVFSALPTSGGIYYWAGVLGGKHGPFCAWMAAWVHWLGQVGGTAGVEYTVVIFCESLIQVYKPDFTFNTGGVAGGAKFWAVYFGFIVFHGVLNAISVRLVGWLSVASIFWHMVGTIIIVVGLPIIAPTHQAASWVFGSFIPPSSNPVNDVADPGVGISNNGYIFLVGLLLSNWALVGYETSALVAEDTKNAAVAGPKGLLLAIIGTFFFGWVFLLSLTFSIQDAATDPYNGTFAIIESVFTARYGSPNGSIAFMIIFFVASNFSGIFCVTSNCHFMYAIARDIPALRWVAHVNPHTKTTINSIIVMGSCVALLGLTMLGSTVAFNALASIGVIGLQLSYVIPIFLRLTVARKWFKKGPFHLGSFSIVIGWIAVVWAVFMTVILALPTEYPVTSKNLNYAGIALAATVVLALAGWVLTARSWYTGPIRNVDTAQKTLSLADAYMKGELDGGNKSFGTDNKLDIHVEYSSSKEVVP